MDLTDLNIPGTNFASEICELHSKTGVKITVIQKISRKDLILEELRSRKDKQTVWIKKLGTHGDIHCQSMPPQQQLSLLSRKGTEPVAFYPIKPVKKPVLQDETPLYLPLFKEPTQEATFNVQQSTSRIVYSPILQSYGGFLAKGIYKEANLPCNPNEHSQAAGDALSPASTSSGGDLPQSPISIADFAIFSGQTNKKVADFAHNKQESIGLNKRKLHKPVKLIDDVPLTQLINETEKTSKSWKSAKKKWLGEKHSET